MNINDFVTRRPEAHWAHFLESETDTWIAEGLEEVSSPDYADGSWYCRSGDNVVLITKYNGRVEIYDTRIRRHFTRK